MPGAQTDLGAAVQDVDVARVQTILTTVFGQRIHGPPKSHQQHQQHHAPSLSEGTSVSVDVE